MVRQNLVKVTSLTLIW